MLEQELEQLKVAFDSREKPEKWLREGLHPEEKKEAKTFEAAIKAGGDLTGLFQSDLPYFTYLSDKGRLAIFSSFLGTIAKYDLHVFDVVEDLESERGQELLECFSDLEHDAMVGFIAALAEIESMKPYAQEVQELIDLVEVE
ncbi:hypothetical protein N9B94_04625 [Verrucomicrobia bacterium]|nr:hypothetical protein [Verrucomicrobiota bacterium]MDB4459073.1 hypothetical protein [bacterium]